jgi:transposase
VLAICAIVGNPHLFPVRAAAGAMREHGVVVEEIPWSEGKRSVTRAMMGFLARWGRRLRWRETAQVFQTSWEAVYRSVEWFVQWGLAERQLQQVWSIGIDEIHWGQGKRGRTSFSP